MHPAAPNPTPGPEALATLRGHFLNLDSAQHGAKWDQLWAEDFAPWDRGLPNPALDDALAERRDLFGARVGAHGGARKKALVPGCGRGYDVLLLSAAGYDAYGLELSDTALQGARALERESGGMEEYRVRDAAVGRGRVTYLAGDFFQDDFREGVEGGGKFDLIYDYTFFCALPPSLRPAWSKRYSELLSPTGRLICLEFPSAKSLSTGGPPYAVPPKVYEGHLPRPGEDLAYDEQGDLLQERLGPESSHGLMKLAHFHPRRTHAGGMAKNGNVEDWISVWSHKPTA